MKNKRTHMLRTLLITALAGSMALSAACTGAVSRETAEDVQLDVMVASAKTKADHMTIAARYRAEAKAEAAKAKSLRDQSEAYKTHKHDVYSRNILDLIEHTEALARNYQEASDRHMSLAKIHEQIASETKQ